MYKAQTEMGTLRAEFEQYTQSSDIGLCGNKDHIYIFFYHSIFLWCLQSHHANLHESKMADFTTEMCKLITLLL